MCAGNLPRAAAQTPGDYTFNVYADAIYGDDKLATLLNPTTTTGVLTSQPLADYPSTSFPDPAIMGMNGNGALQHAPFSFRTLTGSEGALAYVQANFIATGGLPWPGQNGRNVRWVIIHCLPGLYGPDSTTSSLGDFDAASGLRYNGEEFPVLLPKGISLQGTSALDTIFDGRGLTPPIIVTGGFVGTPASAFEYMIDGLTIRGSVSDGEPPYSGGVFNLTGTGIYIGREDDDIPLTVSNCFIVDNAVGIAVEGDPDFAPSPIIVNNTIAWNIIGLWSGNRVPFQTNLGYATPVVFNNVFDTRRPDDPDELQRSPFVGVHPFDLTVATLIPLGGPPPVPVGIAFNAWDTPLAGGMGALAVSNYPAPGLRAPAATPYPPPVVDIGPFMGTAAVARGILYVNDAFRASPVSDISPHDFRLTPNVVEDPATITPGTPIAALNPLVNAGIDLGADTPRYTSFTMGNGAVVATHPGINLTAASLDPDVFHSWDWDAEGTGNPRIRCRAGFLSFGSGPAGNVDLGADEMDVLIMAGYLPRTRMFAVVPFGPTEPVPQTAVYFFDLFGASYKRPQYSVHAGLVYNWWDHTRRVTPAEGCADCVSVMAPSAYGSNYTDAVTVPPGFTGPSYRSTFVNGVSPIVVPPTPGSAKAPIMRNLECDFSPTLLTDWHHLWGQGWFGILTQRPDIYGANPWFGDTVLSTFPSGPGGLATDNWHVYSNPAHPTSYWADVVQGTINPPGSYLNGPSSECTDLPSYLLPGAATGLFGPFSPCTGTPGGLYGIGIWGYGDSAAGCPDQLPLYSQAQWLGLRYNCQFKRVPNVDVPTSNLQTFLSVIGDEEFQMSQSAGTRMKRYTGPRLSAIPLQEPPKDTVSRLMEITP